MNEQIQKLLNVCGMPNEDLMDIYSDTNKSFYMQKFAELIVKECADICMEMAAKCAGLPGDGALAKDCADWIKKDFGVEE
jgi:hypothetical protein